MAKRNKIEVDVVAELQKLQKQFGDFKNKVERDGIDAPVQGDFAQFEADWKTEKNKIENDPIYAEVRINARKLEDQVNDLKAKVTKTPIEFKTTLDKRLLGGIEDKLNRIGVRVKSLQDSIARSDEIELIKEDQIKKIDKAKISLTEAFLELDRINKGNVRTGSKDSLMFNFDSNRLKKQAEQFQKQGASILENANIDLFTKLSTGSSSFGALFQEVLTYVAKTGDLTHQLTEEGLTVRDVFTTVLDSVRKVAERENLSVEKFINGFANTGRLNADIIKSVSTLLSSEEKLVSIEDQLGKAQERELFKKNQADQVDNIVKALERLSTVLDEINSKAGNTVLNFDLGQSAGDEAVAAKWTSEAQRRMKIYDKMFDKLGGEQGMQNIYAKMYSSMGGDIEDYMGMFSRSALQKLDSKELTKRLSQFFANIKRLVKEAGEDTDDLDKYLSSFVKGIPDTNFKAIENRVGKTRAANATDLIKESLGGSEMSAEDLKEALKGVEEVLGRIEQILTTVTSKMESLVIGVPDDKFDKVAGSLERIAKANEKIKANDSVSETTKESVQELSEENKTLEDLNEKLKHFYEDPVKNGDAFLSYLRELNQQFSNLTYHAGVLKDLDLSKINSHSMSYEPAGYDDWMGNGALTGLYTTTSPFDGFNGNEWTGLPISIFDQSKIKNLLPLNNTEIYKRFGEFSSAIEKTVYGYILKAGEVFEKEGKKYIPFSKDTDNAQIYKSIDKLYYDYKDVLDLIKVTESQLEEFVSKAQAEAKHIIPRTEMLYDEWRHADQNKGFDLNGRYRQDSDNSSGKDTFITRLLKQAGWNGIDAKGSGYTSPYRGGNVYFNIPDEAVVQRDLPFLEMGKTTQAIVEAYIRQVRSFQKLLEDGNAKVEEANKYVNPRILSEGAAYSYADTDFSDLNLDSQIRTESQMREHNTEVINKETEAIKEETEALKEQAQVSEEVKKKNQDLLDERMKGTKVISQRGITSDDRYSYLQQLDNGQQLSTKVSYDKNGNIQFAEQEILTYKQIENEIIKLEKEVFKYENIKKEVLAKGGSTVETDNLIVYQQKEIERLEKILKDMESGPNSANYVYGANEANLFKQRRADEKRLRELQQLSKEEQKIQKPKPAPSGPTIKPIDNRDLVTIQKYRNEIEQLKVTLTQYNGLNEVFKGDQAGREIGVVLEEWLGKIDNDIIKTKDDLADLKNGFDLASNEFKGFIDSGKGLTDLNKQFDDLINDTSKTQAFRDRVSQALSDSEINKTNISLEELKENLRNAAAEYARLAKESKQAENILADQGQLTKWTAKIDKFIGDNSALGSGQKEQLIRLKMKLDGAEVTAQQLKEVKNEFFEIQSAAYGAGQTGTSAIENLRNRIKQMSTNFIAMYFSFYDIARYTKEVMESVKEFDTALTEMRKVSDESINTLKNFQAESFSTADAVGSTALALQQSTADWLRLGESITEAKKSAETTTVLLNVSEFENVDEATEALVSASQAYNDLEKLDIVDKLNIIGNNFSISTDQLATGLQNAAAVLKTQGNDIEEALALLTAGNAITQDISKASAGIRTIALRIAGTEEAKNQLVEMGEDTDDFIVATHAKMQELIKDYTAVASNAYEGVDILDANGNLKDTYTILLDIAKVYQEILDTDKQAGTNRGQALVEAIAGKNRSNIAASILLNPQMLEDVYTKATQSKGSANEELDKYLDSIEGHLARLQNAGQELIFDLQASDEFKQLIDLGTQFLEIVDKIVEEFGALPTLLTAVGGAFSALHIDDIANFFRGGVIKGENINTVKGFAKYAELFAQVNNLGIGDLSSFAGSMTGSQVEGIKDLPVNYLIEGLVGSNVSEEVADLALEIAGLDAEERKAIKDTNEFGVSLGSRLSKSLNAVPNKIKGIGSAIKSLGTSILSFFAANPIALVATSVAAVAAGAALAYKAYKDQGKKARQAIEESFEEYQTHDSNIAQINEELEQTKQRIEEINALPSLSIEDKEELQRLQMTNAELERRLILEKQAAKAAAYEVLNTAQDKNKREAVDRDYDEALANLRSYERQKNDLLSMSAAELKKQYEGQEEYYQQDILHAEEGIAEAQKTILEQQNSYINTRDALLIKYDNDLEKLKKNAVDYSFFKDISSKISEAYRAIYTDSEFRDIVVNPMFSDNNLKDAKSKMITAISEVKAAGGKVKDINWSEVLGTQDWNRLSESMELSGIKIKDVTNSLTDEIHELDVIKKRFGEIDSVLGIDPKKSKELTKDLDYEGWKDLAEHTDDYMNAFLGIEKAATSTAASFDEAKASVTAFLKGTKDDNGEDIPSELEDIQNALVNTKNMSAETYATLIKHSQQYSNTVSIENGRLVVNRDRLYAVANSRIKEQKETLKQVSNLKKLEYIKHFRELKMYDDKLVDTTSDTYKQTKALQDEITQLDLLSNQLDNVSDSFERFKEAQSTENAPDYGTGMNAFNAIKEGLTSGKVGTDDFKYAMQALMSTDEYKEFVALADKGYEAQYKFMEKWQKTNAKFFTEDDRKNAIAWQDYLKETGLLQDGMIASSEEIGKKAGLSYDAVNALNENLNQYDFDGKIVSQYQIDYIDEANEALTNLTNAQEAYNKAVEDGSDQNLITGLKEDLEKAQVDYDEFISNIPKKIQEARESVASGDKATLVDALIGDNESDASAFMEVLGSQIDQLTKKAEEFEKTNQKAALDSSKYKEVISDLETYKNIYNEIAHANYEKTIADEEYLAKQSEQIKNIQNQQKKIWNMRNDRAALIHKGYDENSDEVKKIDESINAIQYSLAEMSDKQIFIDIQLRKDALDTQIKALEEELGSFEEKYNKIDVSKGGGAYQAQYAMQQSQQFQKISEIEKLKTEYKELESTIKFVTDAKEAEEKRDELSKDIETDVDIDIKDDELIKVEKLKNILTALKEMGNIEISVSANVSGGGSISPETLVDGGISEYVRSHGLARANGTAHADGNWSLQSNEPDALLGELGPEGLVRDGKFYLIGKKGPERKNLKKGDIIFNHKQTEELLKNGYATERGTLIGSGHALGTILGSAFANANNKMDPVNIRTGSSTVSKAAKQATEDIKDDIDEVEKESEEQTDNFIDWIERRIKHFSTYAERYLNQAQKALDKVTNTLYSGGQKGNKAFKVFDKTIDSLYKTASNSQRDLMEVQQEAYTAYTNLTNAVGLDPEYQNRIKYGLMEIENVTDETLKDQISKYQDYYDKSQEALDNFIEAAEKFYHLPIDKAAEKIENLSNKIEYLGKVSDNTIGYKNKNEILKEQDRQQRLTYKAQKQANKETQKNLKTAKKQAKKETKDQINEQIKRTNAKVKQEKKEVKSKKALASADKAAKKEIKQATKSNKAIDLTKLKKGTKAYKEAKQYNAALTDKAGAKLSKKELKTGNVLNLENFEEGSAAYKAVVKYNAAINAQTEAWNNAKNAEEEYLHWHQVEYPKAAFDNIANDFNHTVEMMNHDFTDYSNQINELIKAGKKVSTGYYRAQKDINALKMEEYIMERAELEDQLGKIQRYSDEWYEAYGQIKEVDNAISQLNISTMELNESMRQLYLDSFQGVRNDIETLIGEQEFLLSLMSHNKKTDNEIGYFTDEGLVNLTSGVATATMAQAKQRNTASEIKELQDLLDKGELKWRDTQFESIDQLKDQIRDLYGTWQGEIKDTYEAQSAIVDLMKERYQAELEMYKDLVSSKKEALSAEKDLYEYQKKIAEKTKSIALLEKQLAAYAGDSSQEGQAKRQKLQSDLNKTQEDLRDTEYDKYISDQQQMLDDLIGEYEERIEKKLNDFNGLLAEGIAISSEQGQETIDALNQIAKDNGYIPLKMDTFNSNLSGTVEGQTEAFQSYFNDVFGASGASKIASLVTNSQSVIDKVNKIASEDGTIKAEASVNTDNLNDDTDNNKFLKAIKDSNSVDTRNIIDAIKTIGGKTATENAEGNDPVAQAKKEQAAKEAVSSVAPAVSTASTIADIQTALTSVSAGTATAKSSINNEADIKKQANDFIKKNAKTGRANKNGKDFGPVNKQIAKFMGTEGEPLDKMKVLTTAELDDLAKMIGLKNRNDSNFEKKLKELHIAGFAHGGLVEAIKRNGDDGIATLKVGEAILTPTDSKNLASLANKFEAIDVTADIMNMLKETAKDTSGLGTPQNIDYGGVQFNFELPNVNDSKSFINAIQTDSNLQKAIQSVSVDRINNGGRLSVNRIR